MNGVMLWLGLAGAEVLLVVFILLLVYWLRHSSAARRDRQAVSKLVAKVRKGRTERETVIAGFLSGQLGLSGDALEKAKVAILREELKLLQQFATVYRRRDSGTAAQFQLSVEAAVAPYHALSAGEAVPVATGDGVDDSDLEGLRRENARLSEELSVTMETMSRMLNEYSSMFPTAGSDGDLPEEASAGSGAGNGPGREPEQPDEADLLDEPIPDDGSEQVDESEEVDEPEAVADPGQGGMDNEPDEPPLQASGAVEGFGKEDPVADQATVSTAVEPGEPRKGGIDEDDIGDDADPAPTPAEHAESTPNDIAPEEAQQSPGEPAVEADRDGDVDSPVDTDPLEDGLGDLFDDDDIGILDGADDKPAADTEESKVISI